MPKSSLGPMLYLNLVHDFGFPCLFRNITAIIDSMVKYLASACQSGLTLYTGRPEHNSRAIWIRVDYVARCLRTWRDDPRGSTKELCCHALFTNWIIEHKQNQWLCQCFVTPNMVGYVLWLRIRLDMSLLSNSSFKRQKGEAKKLQTETHSEALCESWSWMKRKLQDLRRDPKLANMIALS